MDLGALGLTDAEIKEAEREQAIASSEVKEQRVDGVEVIGEDEGGKRVLTHLFLDPRVPGNRKIRSMPKEQISEIFTKMLEDHCISIGWWPDGEGPDFALNQTPDGVWHLWSKLSQSTRNRSKSWEDFPRARVDTRSEKDVLKGK